MSKDKRSWYLNVLRTKRVNRDNAIASWKKDIFFATEKKVAGLGFRGSVSVAVASMFVAAAAAALLLRRRRAQD